MLDYYSLALGAFIGVWGLLVIFRAWEWASTYRHQKDSTRRRRHQRRLSKWSRPASTVEVRRAR